MPMLVMIREQLAEAQKLSRDLHQQIEACKN